MDDVSYVKLIQELRPTVYVVPDAFKDAEGTLERWRSWQSLRDALRPSIPMFVLHWTGDMPTTTDMATSVLYAEERPIRIGLAKAMGGKQRIEVARELSGYSCMHALGFSDDMLLRELPLLRWWNVRSIDSTVPINRGLQGRRLTQRYESTHTAFDSRAFPLGGGNIQMAKDNLELVDFLCR